MGLQRWMSELGSLSLNNVFDVPTHYRAHESCREEAVPLACYGAPHFGRARGVIGSSRTFPGWWPSVWVTAYGKVATFAKGQAALSRQVG